MTVQIQETRARFCCQSDDMIPYEGQAIQIGNDACTRPDKLMFCRHCGQLWHRTRRMGPAGSMESNQEPLKVTPVYE